MYEIFVCDHGARQDLGFFSMSYPRSRVSIWNKEEVFIRVDSRIRGNDVMHSILRLRGNDTYTLFHTIEGMTFCIFIDIFRGC